MFADLCAKIVLRKQNIKKHENEVVRLKSYVAECNRLGVSELYFPLPFVTKIAERSL